MPAPKALVGFVQTEAKWRLTPLFCRLAWLSGAEQGLEGEETSPLGLQGDETPSMIFDLLIS